MRRKRSVLFLVCSDGVYGSKQLIRFKGLEQNQARKRSLAPQVSIARQEDHRYGLKRWPRPQFDCQHVAAEPWHSGIGNNDVRPWRTGLLEHRKCCRSIRSIVHHVAALLKNESDNEP